MILGRGLWDEIYDICYVEKINIILYWIYFFICKIYAYYYILHFKWKILEISIEIVEME